MNRITVVTLLSILTCLSNISTAQLIVPYLTNQPQTQPTGSHAQRSLAALRLADEAAQAGLLDVSVEAVRRAIGDGPPVEAVQLGSILGGGQPNPRIIRNNNQQNVTHENTLAQKLAVLDATWTKVEADPEQIYTIWRDAVFPPARPGEAFAYGLATQTTGGSYSLSLSPNKPPVLDECGCRSLVQWAKKAARLDDLNKVLDQRAEQPAAGAVVELTRLLIAIEDENADREKICSSVAADARQLLVTGRTANQTAYFVSQLVEKMPADSPARLKLVDSISAAVSGQKTWLSNEWLRYLVATETNTAIKAGDWDRFNRLFSTMESILDPLRSGNAEYVQQTVSRAYASAANTAFEASHLEFGLRCLNRQMQNSAATTGRTMVPGSLLDLNGSTFRELLSMPHQQRYDALSELVWTMPMLGLGSLSTYAPREEFPERFVENYKSYRKKTMLPIEQACSLGGQSLSALEWVMRDAIALGKQDEVLAKIAKLREDGSDDALLAEVVWAKAQDKPIDVGKLLSTDDEGKQVLRPELDGSRGALLPIDLDIASAAIQSPDTHAAGVDLAERFTARAFSNRTNIISHGRRLLTEAHLLGEQPPTESTALKHFVATGDYRVRAIHSGQPRKGYWVKNEDGNWEHRASAARSMLLLKYPLTGDFQITFDCNDGTYAESAATALGLNIDFRGYLTNVAVEYVGERGKQQMAADSIKVGEKNSVKLTHSDADKTLSLSLNDEPVGVFRTSEATFPFVGPQSMMHRQMALEDFKITGSPVIPRSLDLLSASLIGWSNLFHSRRLPPPVDLRQEVDLDDAGAGSNAAPDDQTKSVVVGHDWEYVDGVLQTIDHEALFAADQKAGVDSKKRYQRTGEEWIYYVRPLCDGEVVDFEFYHETGAYSLHPTIDRIALQLGEQLREHWVVSDPNLFGISSTNRRDVASDQVLGKVKMLEKQWNRASLSRTGDTITLAINGNDLYRQQVDPAYNGRFGFMGNPSQFQVKVRSITLRGDWPEALPEDLFEEK
ncbi:MAG: hypothetical protein Aurels2KO_46250 [Aureliella sp.]